MYGFSKITILRLHPARRREDVQFALLEVAQLEGGARSRYGIAHWTDVRDLLRQDAVRRAARIRVAAKDN